MAEFVDHLRSALLERVGQSSNGAQQAIEDAKMEAEVGSLELTARFEAARAAGDRDAEHEIWREREERQRIVQQKVDAAGTLAETLSLHLSAFEQLADKVGVRFS